jgi:hypothetical protein
MMGGGGMPPGPGHAPVAGEPPHGAGGPPPGAGGGLRFTLPVGPGGEVGSPKQISPRIRQLPGGGLQIEIREEGETKQPKAEATPARKKPQDKQPDKKSSGERKESEPKIGAKPTPKNVEIELRAVEEKSPSDKPKGSKEEEIRRLREQEAVLRGFLDELRKATSEKKD